MGETGIAVGRLGSMSETASSGTVGGALADGSVEVLHTEQMRGDERVPPNVRQNSRFEGFERALIEARSEK